MVSLGLSYLHEALIMTSLIMKLGCSTTTCVKPRKPASAGKTTKWVGKLRLTLILYTLYFTGLHSSASTNLQKH